MDRPEIPSGVVPIYFFEQNILLAISACGDQVFVHTTRFVVDPRSCDTHDLILKTRVQNPTLGANP